MASKYQDKIIYKADIESVFEYLSSKYSTAPDYVENHDEYTISFSYGPGNATHGEIATIKLNGSNLTEVFIQSQSINNEFDCGNNKTHVMMIISGLNKKFESIAVSEKTKRDSKVTKIVGIIIAIIAATVVISIVSSLFGGGSSGHSNSECAACGGSGMVNEGFLDFETCPVCHGTGLPPH